MQFLRTTGQHSYEIMDIHIYKDACARAQAKGLPSLIYHEPVLEVRFMAWGSGQDENFDHTRSTRVNFGRFLMDR